MLESQNGVSVCSLVFVLRALDMETIGNPCFNILWPSEKRRRRGGGGGGLEEGE